MNKKIKLFCIPYAGGSARVFYQWRKLLHSSIELIPIELAGRGERYKEAFYEDFHEIVDDVYGIIKSHLDENTNYGIFGHSMGGYVVYELYNLLPKKNLKHIFFSGMRPPHLKLSNEINNNSDRDELIRELIKLGGTPQEILNRPELLDMFLPIIKADFNLISKYKFLNKTTIQTPMSILYGIKDTISEDIFEWESYVEKSEDCKFYSFSGGHFFIQDNNQQVIDTIYEVINKLSIYSHNYL